MGARSDCSLSWGKGLRPKGVLFPVEKFFLEAGWHTKWCYLWNDLKHIKYAWRPTGGGGMRLWSARLVHTASDFPDQLISPDYWQRWGTFPSSAPSSRYLRVLYNHHILPCWAFALSCVGIICKDGMETYLIEMSLFQIFFVTGVAPGFARQGVQ